jgi:hypothetical protein
MVNIYRQLLQSCNAFETIDEVDNGQRVDVSLEFPRDRIGRPRVSDDVERRRIIGVNRERRRIVRQEQLVDERVDFCRRSCRCNAC